MELVKKENIIKKKTGLIFAIISFVLGVICLLLTGNVVFLSECWSIRLPYLGIGPKLLVSFIYNFNSISTISFGFVGVLFAVLSYVKGSKKISILGFCVCIIGLSITLLFSYMTNIKLLLSLFKINYLYILERITWILVGMPK